MFCKLKAALSKKPNIKDMSNIPRGLPRTKTMIANEIQPRPFDIFSLNKVTYPSERKVPAAAEKIPESKIELNFILLGLTPKERVVSWSSPVALSLRPNLVWKIIKSIKKAKIIATYTMKGWLFSMLETTGILLSPGIFHVGKDLIWGDMKAPLTLNKFLKR